ncbi:MAG: nucleotidyltransferase family protein [Lachnospiraceae bacterium]|nr:nucleotidyltransferase family protein [Lachnospiraceae bacterium]
MSEKTSFDKENKTGLIIMASGQAARFGRNKLMEHLGDRRVIDYVVSATEDLGPERLLVISDSDDGFISYCKSLQIPVLSGSHPFPNDTVKDGLLTLLKRCPDLSGVIFIPADMPLIKKESMEAMLSSIKSNPNSIIRARFGGTEGSPVCFPKDFFDELLTLPEGCGGSHVIKNHRNALRFFEVSNECELWDIDYPADLDKILKELC